MIPSEIKDQLLCSAYIIPSKSIRDIYPTIKVIFISVYTEDTFRKNLDVNAQIHFLQKPFTLMDLAQKVKDVLKSPDVI